MPTTVQPGYYQDHGGDVAVIDQEARCHLMTYAGFYSELPVEVVNTDEWTFIAPLE